MFARQCISYPNSPQRIFSEVEAYEEDSQMNLASLYELFTEPDIKLQYIKTSLQRADPYTKALEPYKWKDALELLNVIPPELDSKT